MKPKIKEFFDTLLVIPSSIFASIIYNSLATEHYVLSEIDSVVTIIPVERYNALQAFLIVGGIFFVIWICVSLVKYYLAILYRTIWYSLRHSPRKYKRREIIATYRKVKETIISISELLQADTYSSSDPKALLLRSSEFMASVNELYKVFCKPGGISIPAVFRNNVSIENVGTLISSYEYEALISCIEAITSRLKFHQTEDSPLFIDLERIEDRIKELKRIVLT